MSTSPEEIHPSEGSELGASSLYYHEMRQEGYEPVSVLRNSDRYVAYEVMKERVRYFFKGVKAVAPSKLKTEEWFSEQINTRSGEDAIVVTPKIIESKPNWYVAEF